MSNTVHIIREHVQTSSKHKPWIKHDFLVLTLSSALFNRDVYCLSSGWSALYLTPLWNWVKDLRLGGHPAPSLLGPTPHSPCQAAGKQQWPSNSKVNSYRTFNRPGGANVSVNVFITVTIFAYWKAQLCPMCISLCGCKKNKGTECVCSQASFYSRTINQRKRNRHKSLIFDVFYLCLCFLSSDELKLRNTQLINKSLLESKYHYFIVGL